MIGRIWAIALNTFREAARIRVLYGILVLVLGSNLLAVFVGELSLTLPADADVDAWIARAHAAGARVLQVAPRHETLEELFVRRVAAPAGPPETAPGAVPAAAIDEATAP